MTSALALAAIGCNIQRQEFGVTPGSSTQDDDAGTDGTDGAEATDAAAANARLARVSELGMAFTPLAEATCEWMFGCCTDTERFFELGPQLGSVNECAEAALQYALYEGQTYGSFGLSFSLARFPTVVQQIFDIAASDLSATLEVDEAAVAECARALRAAPCNEDPERLHCSVRERPAAAACDRVLVGRGRPGDACLAFVPRGNAGCQTGTACQAVDDEHGVCVPLHAERAPCTHDGMCQSGLLCDERNGRCIRGLSRDETCEYMDPSHPDPGTERTPCGPGLACDTAALRCVDESCYTGKPCYLDTECPKGTQCVSAQCGFLRQAGESCKQDEDCASSHCVPDFPSNDAPSHCAYGRAIDEPCAYDAQCSSRFCHWTTPTTLRCAERSGVGGPCASARDSECSSGTCDYSGTGYVCTQAGLRGALCSGDLDCATQLDLGCVNGFCHALRVKNGLACVNSVQCLSGYCNAAGRCSDYESIGQPCGGQDSLPCADDAYCSFAATEGLDGICVRLKSEGVPCGESAECIGYCTVVFGERRCTGSYYPENSCTGPKR